jgi:chitinase
VTHAFKQKGSYSVSLRVTDDRGSSDTKTIAVSVSESPAPTAAFSFAPDSPEVLQSVFFNAAASKAAPGRTLVAFDWTFGDGGFGSGVTTTHRWGTKGSYAVTLTVTDDIGKTATTTSTVSLGDDQVPTAAFTSSPTSPTVSDVVNFDARTSSVPPGRRLVEWQWNFGDGTFDSGERVQHRFTKAGSYVVTLTVKDSSGATNSTTSTVTVQ